MRRQKTSEPMQKLTEKTWIPLGLAVVVIGGGAAWMTKINISVDTQVKSISEYREEHGKEVREVNRVLREIDRRLSTIEGELKRIRQ